MVVERGGSRGEQLHCCCCCRGCGSHHEGPVLVSLEVHCHLTGSGQAVHELIQLLMPRKRMRSGKERGKGVAAGMLCCRGARLTEHETKRRTSFVNPSKT